MARPRLVVPTVVAVGVAVLMTFAAPAAAAAAQIVVDTLADIADPPFDADDLCGMGTVNELPGADGNTASAAVFDGILVITGDGAGSSITGTSITDNRVLDKRPVRHLGDHQSDNCWRRRRHRRHDRRQQRGYRQRFHRYQRAGGLQCAVPKRRCELQRSGHSC